MGANSISVIARRYRDIVAAVAADQGGADFLSEVRLQLVRRFAAATALAERMEARLVRGEKIDVAEHALLCRTLVRIAQRIGVDRITSHHLTPSLADYLCSQQKETVDDPRQDTRALARRPDLVHRGNSDQSRN